MAFNDSLSKTCLVRFESEEDQQKVRGTFCPTNRYSVDARAVGRPIEIRAYADRLECWQDGQVVARHDRAFGRGKTIYDPLHYIPVLARKPPLAHASMRCQAAGALRSEPCGRHWFETLGERAVQGLGSAAGPAPGAAQA